MFHQFWPNILKQGLLYRLQTPMIVAEMGKKRVEFLSRQEYDDWATTAPKHKFRYYKGLGSWQSKDFARFMSDSDKYHIQLQYEDADDFECVDLAFDKSRADDRKEWLSEDQIA